MTKWPNRWIILWIDQLHCKILTSFSLLPGFEPQSPGTECQCATNELCWPVNVEKIHLTWMNFILVWQLYSSKSQAKPHIAYDTQLFQILPLQESLFNMEIYQLYCLLLEFFTSVK